MAPTLKQTVQSVEPLLEQKDYDKVIEVLEGVKPSSSKSPVAPKLHLLLSTAYQRKGQYAKAFNEAQDAIFYAKKDGIKSEIAEGQLRRAISLFLMNRYDEALYSVEFAFKYNSATQFVSMAEIWKQKINLKLENKPYDVNFITITEIPRTATEYTDLSSDQTSSSTSKSEITEPCSKLSGDSSTTQTSIAPVVPAAPTAPAQPVEPVADKIKFDWYQNSSSINVSLFIKNAPKEKVKVEFTSSSASISFPLASGSEFLYDLDPLAKEIDPKASTFRVFQTKIELTLAKSSNVKWADLLSDGAEHAQGDKSKSVITVEDAQKGLEDHAPSYPTSSKSGPKQWDSIIKDEVAELEKKENEDDPNAFFRTIFAQADPDTQRAMMKSYTESNGTALSTNWEDVSKKTFETNPPDGMEAKSWK